MLTSAITAATSAVTMTGSISIGLGGALVAVLLILLLSSRELITTSSKRSKKIITSLDSLIVPLFLVFALSVAFEVIAVISPIN